MSNKSMTVAEAGRLGGLKVKATRGPDYFKELGRKGGKATPSKFKAGDEKTSGIAKLGGIASPGKFVPDTDRARLAGKKGGAARAAQIASRKNVETTTNND